MHEVKNHLKELKRLIDQGLLNVDLEVRKREYKELEVEMQKEDFWNDSEKAQEVAQEASDLKKLIETWEGVLEEVEELIGLLPEIHAENDPEAAEEYKAMVNALNERWRKLEISTFLSGKYDKNNAIITLHAGTGGTDAADFAEMLLRMYMRYSERMGFKVEMVDRSDAEEAGIKSATFTVSGPFAYGYLHCEHGVHRLVRLSPFNSKGTRETSFAMVEVMPEIKQKDHMEIKESDLRVDVFRAGGKGGQSVNTTDSAVRITHIPTGIVAQCQNERSQLQNKEQSMAILQARLNQLMMDQQAEKIEELRGGKVEHSWGNQIRSYVLHPYKMVKDHRTNYEESNPEKVFDGELDGFIESELKK